MDVNNPIPLIYQSGYLTIKGELKIGELFAFLTYFTMILAPVHTILGVINNFPKVKVSLNRVLEILPKEKDKIELKTTNFDLVIKNLEFSYSNNKIFENLNLFIKERIAKMTGGVAVIRVGGSSETEVEEKKDRIDDALGATRAAIEGGIISGGGCALLHAAQKINMVDLDIRNADERAGVEIMLEAIKQPLKHIVTNAGKSGDYVAETVITNSLESDGFGYNAATEEYGNMFEMGIIDPVNVTKSALKNAASVATLLLTSKTILMKPNQEKLACSPCKLLFAVVR